MIAADDPSALRGQAKRDESVGPPPIKVFAHLARDKDAENWRLARAEGTLVGVNDETPHGYHRAERMGCRVAFSRSDPQGRGIKFLRLPIRALTGFDLMHALRQKKAMVKADIVWPHTESQYLAVAVMLLTGARSKFLGQSVWLMDRWATLGSLHAKLMRSFERATVVCVPLRPDLHASGITVVQEAALAGVPVVVPDTGGLDAYFARDEVRFVPPDDIEGLREALLETARDAEAACARARRAQARMIEGTIGAEAYIRQHVELSREILQR